MAPTSTTTGTATRPMRPWPGASPSRSRPRNSIPLQTLIPHLASPSSTSRLTSNTVSPSTASQTTIGPPPSSTQSPAVASRLASRMPTPATSTTVALTALAVTFVFGIGAWVGQTYGNYYAKKSYQVSLWGLCADHPVRRSTSFLQTFENI